MFEKEKVERRDGGFIYKDGKRLNAERASRVCGNSIYTRSCDSVWSMFPHETWHLLSFSIDMS